jgi:hypothetical protein
VEGNAERMAWENTKAKSISLFYSETNSGTLFDYILLTISTKKVRTSQLRIVGQRISAAPLAPPASKENPGLPLHRITLAQIASI